MSTREKRQMRAGLGLEYFDGYWRYTIHDAIQTQQTKRDIRRITRIIVDAKTGKDCGLVMVDYVKRLALHILTLEDGYHYRDALYPVLRQSVNLKPKTQPWRFCTRIPSYTNFILAVRSELEGRVVNSCLAGMTWQLNFFRKMITTRERIAKAKTEGRPDKKPLVYSAEFAPLSFTRLLVGDLSIEEMLHFYGECSVSGGDEARLMLDILFPKQLRHLVDTFWWSFITVAAIIMLSKNGNGKTNKCDCS
ncbi:hypothetical protein BGZ65_008350 [Modicella reniformis]|uniref:Uncharacterized protein n=1 Tax=Modicella reniformis TaxID=1440133 RepID=A0A9P6IJB1_9FUNG|nr:hypothetical protein BGZ65_008350 [Modicella reniformis]